MTNDRRVLLRSLFFFNYYYLDDLDRYSELMNLSDRNEKLFFRVMAGRKKRK